MAITYIQAIGIGFPAIQVHSSGDGSVYEDLIWDSGPPLPSKETLDAWIAANPSPIGIELTKYEFRSLFTLTEKVAIDNYQSNPNIPDAYKAILLSILKDLELSGIVRLSNPDTISGVNFIEQLGLIGPGRAAQILSNSPHP